MAHEMIERVDLTDYQEVDCLFAEHEEIARAIAKHFVALAIEKEPGASIHHTRGVASRVFAAQMDVLHQRISEQILTVEIRTKLELG